MKWVIRFFIGMVAAAAIIALLTFLIDPLQHYRAAKAYRPVYANERMFNDGLARHADYNAALIGSSMTQNFLPTQIDAVLGVKLLRLSIAAGTAYERRLILERVLKEGKAKTVYYGLDIVSFRGAPDMMFYGDGTFPAYLYDDNWENDWRYLLNARLLGLELLRIAAAPERLRNAELSQSWGDLKQYGSAILMRDWVSNSYFAPCREDAAICTLPLMKANFSANLLAQVKANQQTEFVVFFPPYSLLAWLHYRTKQPAMLDTLFKFKAHTIRELLKLPNVRIHDFQCMPVITNYDLYKDIFHYAPSVNRQMAVAFARGEAQIHTLEDATACQNNLLRIIYRAAPSEPR